MRKRSLTKLCPCVQEDKKAIAEAALGDGSSTAAGPARLSLEELRVLFGLGRGGRRQAASTAAPQSSHADNIVAAAERLIFPQE